MKYSLDDQAILVDGQPMVRIQTLTGEYDGAKVADLIAAANRWIQRPQPASPAPGTPGMVNDIDETGAGSFLAAHHVPIISPDIGVELIKIVKRIEVVKHVYPLPPTVEVYVLALHLLLQVATEHQRAFCAKVEELLGKSD
jgi:hypothetical protein